jgi:hypothetical protein
MLFERRNGSFVLQIPGCASVRMVPVWQTWPAMFIQPIASV